MRESGLEPSSQIVNPDVFREDRSSSNGTTRWPLDSCLRQQLPTASCSHCCCTAPSGRNNLLSHADHDLDDMIIEQVGELDRDRRGEILQDIQRRLLDGAYMFSPVTGSIGAGETWVFHPSVQGFHPNTALSEYFFWATVPGLNPSGLWRPILPDAPLDDRVQGAMMGT